ncbi:hypothetical protein JTB14_005078 [Gonioctena quinquepunctata]|nr:hypothetical protein JTB14_005078 [Gonioctena quinquepunctata]
MYKIKEQDFDVSRNNKNKMKVSRAAKLMSHTVAAAIESMIGSAPEQLPAEAIYTAEFVEDIDSLFDSLNSHSPKFNSKALRRCLSLKSQHIEFWKEILPKVKSWEFHNMHSDEIENTLPFKVCWMFTINGVMEVFSICQKIESRNINSNCEADESSILENMVSFLGSTDNVRNTVPSIEEFQNIVVCTPNLQESKFDTQAITYVAGYLIRKLITSKLLECEESTANLTVANWEPCHTFTMLKEHDAKQRLNYANENLTLFLAQVYDIIYSALPVYGHVENIMRKLKCTIVYHMNTDWFTCKMHIDNIFLELINICVPFIIRKYLNDNAPKQKLAKQATMLAAKEKKQ